MEKKKNKITVYLIKEGKSEKDVFVDYDKYEDDQFSFYVREEKSDNLTFYFRKTYNNVPNWIETFFNSDNSLKQLYNASLKLCVLYKNTQGRFFVIAFGRGKSLIDADAIESHFGLKVVLNLLKQNDLRKVKKVSVGGNQKSSSDQLPKCGNINDFGVDIERDLVNTITGKVSDDKFIEGMVNGADSLTLTAEVDINNINKIIDYCFSIYKKDTYKKDFGWIDNIECVKNKKTIEELNELMVKQLKANSAQFWSAVPEMIDWENVGFFRIQNVQQTQDDIYIDVLMQSFKNGLNNAEQLRNKHISLFDSSGNDKLARWSAYNCIFGKIDYKENTYCINNGKWYQISKDYKETVEQDYRNTDTSNIKFDDFCSSECKNENEYSSMFVGNHKDEYVLMDKHNITYGGGQSKVEVCDILGKKDTFIHVKPYSGSSTLSHLFNQGLVSADLVLADTEFKKLVNETISDITDNKDFNVRGDNKLKVIYAIIQKNKEGELPRLPFFSKVSLRYVKSRLKTMRCDVELAIIVKKED